MLIQKEARGPSSALVVRRVMRCVVRRGWFAELHDGGEFFSGREDGGVFRERQGRG